MDLNKTKTTGFLFDINDPKLNCLLEQSLINNTLSVVGAEGKVNDCDLLSRMYSLREEVEKRVDCDIKEHYVENGDDFTASVSFIKRPRKF